MGVESTVTWARERYADRIARLLPIESMSQPKLKTSPTTSCGKNKQDKLFINKLLKDKGPQSYNWRIALHVLKYSTSGDIDASKDSDMLDLAPSLVPNAGSRTQDFTDSNEKQTLLRRVSSKSRNYRSFRLARKISPPTEWSESNLADYIETLAESQKTQARVLIARKPRLKDWTNIGDIVSAFDNVFYNTALQKFLSVSACNTALRFYYDYGIMTKARSLYIRMEDLKMWISTETFNILLRGSASQKDLHSFTFLLKSMIRRGFKPNEVTWTLFLQVIDSSDVRAVIVWNMAEMNLLDKVGIRRDVAAQMVDYEIVNYLENGHDLHGFLHYMNDRYEIGWLSTTAGNKLLNEVAKRKSVVESLSLLYEMREAGFVPDDISMSTLLRHCLYSRQHELAIEILDIFKHLYRLYPGPNAYETLFLQAWRSRLLNLSSVIWKSACIYGAVSYKIRHLVFQSLLSYTPALDKHDQSDDPPEHSISNIVRFQKFAGEFVAGLDGRRAAALNRALDRLDLDPRTRTLKWAQILMDANLRLARNCVLRSDLPQLLHQALKMDQAWAAEGLYEKDDWRQMLPHAIAVDVEVKRDPLRRPLPHLLTRNATSLRDPNRWKSPRLSADVQRRMSSRRIAKVRDARPPVLVKRGEFHLRGVLSNVWRRSSTQQSPRSRSCLGSILRS